jgi:hypothetical protein
MFTDFQNNSFETVIIYIFDFRFTTIFWTKGFCF